MPLADYLSAGFILVYQAAVSIMGTAAFLLFYRPSRQGPGKNERRKRDTNSVRSKK